MKVLISGYTGKMGVAAVQVVTDDPDLTYIGGTRRGDDLAKMMQTMRPEVVLELTHPSCVVENCKIILNHNAHAVVGTTGLTSEHLSELDQLARKRGKAILVCPNFAIGAILMMTFAAQAAKYLPRVEIIEYHHDQKADSPSGTAIKTAELIRAHNPPLNLIPIHAVRLPGFVASQDVIFGGLGQTLSIRHDTISRESFMPGVILAIKKVPELQGLVYGLEKILSL